MGKYDESDGVWRTVGGRRIFIRDGQSLSDAMKSSGKFKSGKKKDHTFRMNDEEKEKYEKVGKKIDDLTKEIEQKSENEKLKKEIGNDVKKLQDEADKRGMLPSELQDQLGIKDSDLGLKDEYTERFEREMQGMQRELKAEEAKRKYGTDNEEIINAGKKKSERVSVVKDEYYDKLSPEQKQIVDNAYKKGIEQYNKDVETGKKIAEKSKHEIAKEKLEQLHKEGKVDSTLTKAVDKETQKEVNRLTLDRYHEKEKQSYSQKQLDDVWKKEDATEVTSYLTKSEQNKLQNAYDDYEFYKDSHPQHAQTIKDYIQRTENKAAQRYLESNQPINKEKNAKYGFNENQANALSQKADIEKASGLKVKRAFESDDFGNGKEDRFQLEDGRYISHSKESLGMKDDTWSINKVEKGSIKSQDFKSYDDMIKYLNDYKNNIGFKTFDERARDAGVKFANSEQTKGLQSKANKYIDKIQSDDGNTVRFTLKKNFGPSQSNTAQRNAQSLKNELEEQYGRKIKSWNFADKNSAYVTFENKKETYGNSSLFKFDKPEQQNLKTYSNELKQNKAYKNAFEEYKKKHPNTKLNLQRFIDMSEGK